MAEDNKVSYFFLGLGLGLAVGVLFAPQSGEDTRRLLRDKADEGADYMRRRSNELRDTATDTLERGKHNLQRRKESLTAAVEAGRQAYREATGGEAD
jgi:gas vesicle protein